MVTPRRSHFSRDSRVISYLDAAGPGPATPARTLVLLHAFPLAAEMWHPQLDAVPTDGVLSPPTSTASGSPPPGEPSASTSMDDHARDVVALLDHLGLHRALVAGLSMGGYVAFALLRLAAARVSGLVLADTRAEADDEAARANRDRMTETLAEGGPAAVFDGMLQGLLGETTRASRPDIVRRVRDLALAQPADGIRRGIQSLKSRPRLDAAARRHQVSHARRGGRRGSDHERGKRSPDARPDPRAPNSR